MKTLYRIENLLFNKPWAIVPSVHQSLVNQFKAHLTGNVQLPWDDEEEDDALTPPTLEQTSPTALICVDGVIGKHLSSLETMCGGCDVDAIIAQLNLAVTNPDVKNIILYFNTPGGSVTGVPEAAQAIAEAAKIKPVYGYSDTLCASAGYWLASQCSSFYCSPSSDVGSIGVYSLLLDESRALELEGIKVNAISAGKYKLSGASFKPLTDEERAMFQADVDRIYNDFKSSILFIRNISDEYMQGQVFNGVDAVKNNLADGNLNSIEELFDLLETQQG